MAVLDTGEDGVGAVEANLRDMEVWVEHDGLRCMAGTSAVLPEDACVRSTTGHQAGVDVDILERQRREARCVDRHTSRKPELQRFVSIGNVRPSRPVGIEVG